MSAVEEIGSGQFKLSAFTEDDVATVVRFASSITHGRDTPAPHCCVAMAALLFAAAEVVALTVSSRILSEEGLAKVRDQSRAHALRIHAEATAAARRAAH